MSIEVSNLIKEQGRARADGAEGQIEDTNPTPSCPSRNSQFSEEKGKVNRQYQCSGDSAVLKRTMGGCQSSEKVTTQVEAVQKPPRRR